MKDNFQAALRLVLKHEGGFANHPADPGGPTNKGVTLATFRAFVKADGTVADLKAITPAQLEAVYRRQYWDKAGVDELPAGLDYAVFDFAVNSGPSRALAFLAETSGEPAARIVALCNRRLAWLRRLKTWPDFGKGWSRRVSDVKAAALAMAAASEVLPPSRPETAPKPETAPAGLPEAAPPYVRDGWWEWFADFFR